jgi:uncharacterized membrane protein
MPERFTKSIIVKASPAAVYEIWSQFENFPHFMDYIERVKKLGPKMSRWQMAGPFGTKMEWEAETTRLEPNQRIAWNTKDHEGLTTSGEAVFAELPEGQTEVTVTLQYEAPAGKLGEVVGRVFANPEGRLEQDLRNFKRYAEGRKTGAAGAQ